MKEAARILFLASFWGGILFFGAEEVGAAEVGWKFTDSKAQAYHWSVRASEIDPRCKAHPEVGFVLENQGKPADVEHANVDTRVEARGQLVIWLMGYSPALAEKVNGYGMHHIAVAYAREWFSKLNAEPVDDEEHLGNIRLEALTGIDASRSIEIPVPDSMKERSYQLVKYLARVHPEGRWDYFLRKDGLGIDWEKVVMAGASHGATSAARFAVAEKVGRVVMFCGPRDQLERWQARESATPANRFFGYSHTLDGGWSGGHYPRSWILLGLNRFGPVVNTDEVKPPFGNTRRLTTAYEVGGDVNKAHSFVQVTKTGPRDAEGRLIQDEVWRYLFTAPVEVVGVAGGAELGTRMDLRKKVGE